MLCASPFHSCNSFKDHLRSDHSIYDDGKIDCAVQDQRVSPDWGARFWCGFCWKVVALQKKGTQGLDERLDHMDEHFQHGEKVENWIEMESRKAKGKEVGTVRDVITESSSTRSDSHSEVQYCVTLSNPEVLQDQSTPRNDEAHGTEMSREECVFDLDSHGRPKVRDLLVGDVDDSWVDAIPQKNMGGEGSVSRDHDHGE